jgi:hypothetical protein
VNVKIKNFIKSLNLKFLIGLGLFCILAAIANNLRAPEGKSVEWIGGQEVLEKPE